MTRQPSTEANQADAFRMLFEGFGLPAKYAEGKYRVRREVSADESRIDVEVANRKNFVIHIENKIWSGEGYDETNREWRDLQKRAAALDCTQFHAFYLTPNKRKPCNANFRAISWRQIARVLDRFGTEAKPEDVKFFARHYAQVLRKHIIPEFDNEENDDVDEHVQ